MSSNYSAPVLASQSSGPEVKPHAAVPIAIALAAYLYVVVGTIAAVGVGVFLGAALFVKP